MARARVLIVDDDVDVRQSLLMFLERALDGVEVVAAHDGDTAVAMAHEQPIQAVVSDYRMPGMDGLETIQRLKELHPNMGAVLFTAFPDLDIAQTALNRLHVDAFLTKPADPADITRTVAEVLLRSCQDAARDAIVEEMRAIADA